MYGWPTSFPTDAVTGAISIVSSGQIVSQLRQFALCLENVQFWAVGIGLPTDTANKPNLITVEDVVLSAEQKAQLVELGNKIRDAHAVLSPSKEEAGSRAPHKLGDGTLIQTILKWLPTILAILKGIGIQVPPIPIPGT